MRKISLLLFCALCLLASGCTNDFSTRVTDVQEEDIVIDNGEIEILHIDHLVGDIKVLPGNDDTVSIHAKKTTSASSKSSLVETSEKVTVKTHIDANKLTLETDYKEQRKLFDMGSMANNVYIDYTIYVPKRIHTLSIKNGVGDIQVVQLTINVTVDNGVGDIDLKELQLTGENTIESGTGDIALDLSIDDLKQLSVTSGVGSIDVTLPKDSHFRLRTDSGLGDVSGNLLHAQTDTGSSDNSSIPQIEIHTGLGDISVNSK